MEFQIVGSVLPVVEIGLKKGDAIFTESGGMAWYTGQFKMETNMSGGVMGAIGRKLAGESMFMTTYTCESEDGKMTFASSFPGHIRQLALGEGESMICQKDSFMCAEPSVTLGTHWRKKLGVGLLGGEGFVLQKLTGPGNAFVEIAGEVTEVELGPGQVLTVDTGHVALQEPSVEFEVEMVKGVKNLLFGGEGLVLAKLRGPGKVWLQSMPMSNLAARIIPYVPAKG